MKLPIVCVIWGLITSLRYWRQFILQTLPRLHRKNHSDPYASSYSRYTAVIYSVSSSFDLFAALCITPDLLKIKNYLHISQHSSCHQLLM